MMNNKFVLAIFFIVGFLFLNVSFVSAKSGCCSHHGGVSYCGGSGYYICNDGTQSPNFTCYVAPEPTPQIVAPAPVVVPEPIQQSSSVKSEVQSVSSSSSEVSISENSSASFNKPNVQGVTFNNSYPSSSSIFSVFSMCFCCFSLVLLLGLGVLIKKRQ
jgi:hypothetical protein